ncbi:MAG TPA: alkaline phosphatase family protein [Kofleriaceae bacterium]
MRLLLTAAFVVIAIASAVVLGDRARRWNDELALAAPPIASAPAPPGGVDDPRTPRLTGRVVLIVIDGLGADEARLPYLDELRRRGVAATARVPYPTISRPNYVTILTGVPPRDSGVRANRVVAPVAVDTVMDRVRAAGLGVATASDFGSLGSLFLRHTESITGVDWVERGSRIAPPEPIAWPFDDARRVGSLDALGAELAELVTGDAAFVPVLVLDVDRAGHAAGVGEAYRGAAAAVDRMLRKALGWIDLGHDTVIVTADHGHVAPGGHGGVEREVSNVPLVLAGKGVVPGAVAREARLIDVAPTVAALLGVPAPRHAEGRALVELLQLAPDDAARRAATDEARGLRLAGVVAAARAAEPRPVPARLGLLALGLAIAAGLARVARRRGALVVTPAALAGAIGFVVVLVAVVIITRGRMSPSYVPSQARLDQLGAVAVAAAVVVQVIASWRVVRRAPDRLAAASGLALVGLGLALATVTLVRAWFSPPYLEVPPPFWMVAVPALDVAAAACAAAVALTLGLAAVRRGAAPRAVDRRR